MRPGHSAAARSCCPRCDGAGTVPEVEVYLALGPCEGHYMCALGDEDGNVPETITAVVNAAGASAVLDLPTDVVEDGEVAHEYSLVGPIHTHGQKCRRVVVYEHRFETMVLDQRSAAVVHDLEVRRGRAHRRQPATVSPFPGGSAA